MVQTVQLDENDHALTMLRGLKQSQHGRQHCDFIITVQGQEYHAHKIILSLGSPYFKAMLKHDTKEARQGRAEMKDVDFESVKNCIDFMYTARFDIPDGKTGELLHVVIMLQLDGVKDAICGILKRSLNANNFYEIKNTADMYDLKGIVEECKKYYETNFLAISQQPGFKKERKSQLMKILKTKQMSQKDKLSVSLRWVGENAERTKYLFELIKFIELNEISSKYLSDLLHNHPLVSNDFRLFKLINAPLIERAQMAGASEKSVGDNQKILILDDKIDCLKCYDSATDEVTMFRDIKFKHLCDFNVVAMDTYIYVLCKDKSLFRLNVEDRKSEWEQMPDRIVSHNQCPPSVALSGSLFVIGGGGFTPSSDIGKFEPTANKWSKLEDKPEPVSGASLLSLDKSIYCIGGYNKMNHLVTSLCQFTPSTCEWADLEPMRFARSDCIVVAKDQRIFVIGGWKGRSLKEVECYEITSGQWSTLAPMIKGHCYREAHCVDGWIFVVGWNDIEKYDIANDRWHKVKTQAIELSDVYRSISINPSQ